MFRRRAETISDTIKEDGTATLDSLYVGLFGSALLAATVLPGASEILMVSLLVKGLDAWSLWLVATAGNVAGSTLNWWLGREALRFADRRWFPVSHGALERARDEGCDVLLIDTAGRLQNKSDLMAELAKIVRVLKKLDRNAPHGVILVLDATTGQNALGQVEIFKEIAGVTGIVVTKLDGTARGGILVAIAERFRLPIHAIGIGEGLDDLKPFDARDFSRAIAGVRRENEAAA